MPVISARGMRADGISVHDLHPVEAAAAEVARPRGIQVVDGAVLAGRRAEDERPDVAEARLDATVAGPQVAASPEDADPVQAPAEEDPADQLVAAGVVLLVGRLADAPAVDVHRHRAAEGALE